MSESDAPARRESYVAHEAVYAAVGASDAADLLRFPPPNSAPFEQHLKLGSGPDRFLSALNLLMTWGAQRASGLEVTEVTPGEAEHYAGILFDQDGTPEVRPEADLRYGPDGEAFLTAGTTAVLRWPDGKAVRKMRVVYVTDEPRRGGFALGTADEDGVIGETAYFVEHRADDSVWAIVRGFYWAPTTGIFNLKARATIRLATNDAIRQLSALAPGAAVIVEPVTPDVDDLPAPAKAD